MKTKGAGLVYCVKPLRSRSKFAAYANHRCFDVVGHAGRCDEFAYLKHLANCANGVAKKIVRDSTNTTGAAWKGEAAGPNRILRWAMLLPDDKLLALGLNMSKLKPQVVAKLREKAADYDSCIAVAQKLTFLAYGMSDAPEPPKEIRSYLESLFGPIVKGTTECQVCREPLDFKLFAAAKRGKAELETAHANPRMHSADNVGFAHRACNIAQGPRTLDEFYNWIAEILRRVEGHGAH